MRSRRFLLLSGVLVALNLALWLAPQGLALRTALASKLWGPKLMRAQILWSDNAEWRLDRGVITQASPTQIIIHEADGRDQTIALSSTTHVFGTGRTYTIASLSRGWRVLVTWPANGAADSVKVEKRTAVGNGGSHSHP